MDAELARLITNGTPSDVILIVSLVGLLVWVIRRSVEQRMKTASARLDAEFEKQKAEHAQRLLELKSDNEVMQQLISIIAKNTDNIATLATHTQQTLDVLSTLRLQTDDMRGAVLRAVDDMHVKLLKAINALGENNDAGLLQVRNELRIVQKLLEKRLEQIKVATDEHVAVKEESYGVENQSGRERPKSGE